MDDQLLKRKYQKNYEPGDVLFEQGDRGKNFYIIQEGTVQISKESGSDKIDVAQVSSGELLGEMALLRDTSKRSATATAETSVTCLEFPKEKLDQLLEENPKFRKRLIQLLCQRIADTTEELYSYRNRNFLF